MINYGTFSLMHPYDWPFFQMRIQRRSYVGTIYAFSLVLRWSVSLFFFSCYFFICYFDVPSLFRLSVSFQRFPTSKFLFLTFVVVYLLCRWSIKHSAIWVKTMIVNVYCEAHVFHSLFFWSLSYLFFLHHENLPTDTMLMSGPNARPLSDRLRKGFASGRLTTCWWSTRIAHYE